MNDDVQKSEARNQKYTIAPCSARVLSSPCILLHDHPLPHWTAEGTKFYMATDLIDEPTPADPCNAILFHASLCKKEMGHELPHTTIPMSLAFFAEHVPPDRVLRPPTFREQIHALEHRLIQDALVANNGAIGKTAQALGFKHHQSLISLLESTHKDLLHLRVEKRRRGKSIVQPYTGTGQGPRTFKRKQMVRKSAPKKLSARKEGNWEKEAL